MQLEFLCLSWSAAIWDFLCSKRPKHIDVISYRIGYQVLDKAFLKETLEVFSDKTREKGRRDSGQ